MEELVFLILASTSEDKAQRKGLKSLKKCYIICLVSGLNLTDQNQKFQEYIASINK